MVSGAHSEPARGSDMDDRLVAVTAAPLLPWTRRRLVRAAVLAGLGWGSAGLLAACGAPGAAARQPGLARIGFLSGNVTPGSPETEAFRQGLRAAGYVEGRNARIEWRFSDRDELLPQRAAGLVDER